MRLPRQRENRSALFAITLYAISRAVP
jgi:hypothetical protein